ncbi:MULTISPECIES: glycosyltransferase family 8 protein [unclassified Gilliamella]|uniref:glycosyltransferase family 8 protein n=1 Tax=unclassified Gilliamella TaxID=2685620 RepID=UPI001324DE61|nr:MULTISPECIES: glycosyltransferase family 8 protein [unclassified Gilliamella]MWN31251.1 glycosyltransferase family 8 protein [Gilliamella sp. Pra-s60]MWP29890.1 glycosyltransferase family 8 protein [Gilliamella sp. Pra-s54]
MDKSINIAYCTDSNYLEHVGVSITSIILNNMHNDIHFHVFLYDVTIEEQEKLQQISSSITLYSIPADELNKYSDTKNNKVQHINRSMYIRLSVPRLLHGIVDKFIYLDADVLCFTDISPILNTNIDSVICAVTPDSLDEQNMSKNQERLELTSDCYFNSGFLYINVDNWMKFDTENKTNKILLSLEQKELIYPDQDALNIVLQHQVLLIDPNWNYLFTWMDDKQKETFFYNKSTLPYIVHFTGARKMWYQEHTGLAQNIYCFYKHFTPWANSPLESYKHKMRINDYRIYAKNNMKEKKFATALKYYLLYLVYKFKN